MFHCCTSSNLRDSAKVRKSALESKHFPKKETWGALLPIPSAFRPRGWPGAEDSRTLLADMAAAEIVGMQRRQQQLLEQSRELLVPLSCSWKIASEIDCARRQLPKGAAFSYPKSNVARESILMKSSPVEDPLRPLAGMSHRGDRKPRHEATAVDKRHLSSPLRFP